MSFLSDLSRNIGNLFGGGNTQKKRRDDEDRPAPKQMPRRQIQRPNNPLIITQQQRPGQLVMPDLNIPLAGKKPKMDSPVLGGVNPANEDARLEKDKIIESIRKNGKIPQESGVKKRVLADDQRKSAIEQGIKARDEDINGTALERRVAKAREVNGGADFLGLVQGMAAQPEMVVRSALEGVTRKDMSLDTSKLRADDPRRVLYGRDGVHTYQRIGNDAQKWADEEVAKNEMLKGTNTAGIAPVVGFGLAAIDSVPGGKQVRKAGKGILKGGKKVVDGALNLVDDASTAAQKKLYEASNDPNKGWVNSPSRREAQAAAQEAHAAGKTNSPVTPAAAAPKPEAITSANPGFVPKPKPTPVPVVMPEPAPAAVIPEPAPINLGPTPFDEPVISPAPAVKAPTMDAPKAETVMFSGRPHTVGPKLKDGKDPKYPLTDEKGVTTWTNERGLNSARAGDPLMTGVKEPKGKLTQPDRPGWRAEAGPGNTAFIDADGNEYVKAYKDLTPAEKKLDKQNDTKGVMKAIENERKRTIDAGAKPDSKKVTELDDIISRKQQQLDELDGKPAAPKQSLKDNLNAVAKERILTPDEKAVRNKLNEKPASSTPAYTTPVRGGKASVPGDRSLNYQTGDDTLDAIVSDSIITTKGTAKTAGQRADALEEAGIDATKQRKIRNVATQQVNKNTGKITDAGVAKIRAVLDGTDGPKQKAAPAATKAADDAGGPPVDATPSVDDAPEGAKLGTITRQAVIDKRLGTDADIDEVVREVTFAAEEAAQEAGTTLDDIIKKGQDAWEANPEMSVKEAFDNDPTFTPAQQQVFEDYAQEIGTLRDRSGLSLKGGNQGRLYGPRQFLEDGASREYNPSLVNERKRTGIKKNSNGDGLDYSSVPYEHAIKRYAKAAEAAGDRMVDAAENKTITKTVDGKEVEEVVPTGIKVPERAKENLKKSLKDITDKRDDQARLLADGDKKGANKLHDEIQDDINDTFNDFIDEIPDGPGRQDAINSVNSMRGTYEQTLVQTVTLSNIVSRVADQGTKIVEKLKQPLVRGTQRIVGGRYEKMAMEGTEVNRLNTSKAARIAANDFAKGTMMREIKDNFKASVANAGAGRNKVVKGIAKVDAVVRGTGAGIVQAGDLSTSNVREALQLGASRPEAAGLKTPADYTKYFGEYTQTKAFQDDLEIVTAIQNPKIGLAGGEVQKGANGNWSNHISKQVDNAVSTNADRVKPGLGKNRIVREANDLVKGNVTGYAGVGSRVFGTLRDAAIPNRTLGNAKRMAQSGDPQAVAKAQKIAGHAIADSIVLYGVGATAAAAAAGGIVGYTGGQAPRGSSEAAYNKAHNVPSNQWYFNLPGGKRLYFDPARPAGAAGIAADIGGSIVTGAKDGVGATTNVLGQVFDQAGGSSLPKTIMNAYTGYADPGANASDKTYAQNQTKAVLAPATGIFNNVANAMDDKMRAPKGFIENIKSNLPWERQSVETSKDSRGNDIKNARQISGGSSLFSLADNPDAGKTEQKGGDKATPTSKTVDDEITRLQKKHKDVFPTNSNSNATDKRSQKNAELLLGSKVYQSLDDRGKANYMNEVLKATKTKDISDKLADEDRTALLEFKLQSEDRAKKWRDDNNDNAAAFYVADYNNDMARGVLTEKDDNLQEKGGKKYKAYVATINKEYNVDRKTQLLYENISQTEWREMLDPDSDEYDPDTAQLLLNYDDVRTAMGVSLKDSDTSKNKFTEKAAKGGSGGRSGSGRRGGGGSGSGLYNDGKIAFADLPTTLVGTESASKYADDAPLFQPVADLRVPQAQIPNRRTISVKKGISL